MGLLYNRALLVDIVTCRDEFLVLWCTVEEIRGGIVAILGEYFSACMRCRSADPSVCEDM